MFVVIYKIWDCHKGVFFCEEESVLCILLYMVVPHCTFPAKQQYRLPRGVFYISYKTIQCENTIKIRTVRMKSLQMLTLYCMYGE